MIDITVIGPYNRSIVECIDYCNSRGLKTEWLSENGKEKGEYTCIIEPDYYYHDYYLHIQWVYLHHNRVSNRIIIPGIVAYTSDYFCMVSHNNYFYRSRKGFKGPDLTVNTYVIGCKEFMPGDVELKLLCPDDNILYQYSEYFRVGNDEKIL